MILKASELTGKKLRFFTLLFCDPEFASLAAEVVPDTPAGKVLSLLFGWKTKEELQPKAEPVPEVKPTEAKPPLNYLGGRFVKFCGEFWPAKLSGNGTLLPSWVFGERLESFSPPPRPHRGLYSLLPGGNETDHEAPPPKRISLSYVQRSR
jgi:hypothetical protein